VEPQRERVPGRQPGDRHDRQRRLAARLRPELERDLASALAEAAVRRRLAQERAQLGLERSEPVAEEVRRRRREGEDRRDHLVLRPLEDATAPDVEEALVAEAGGADDRVLARRGAMREGAVSGAPNRSEVALD